MRCFIEYVWLVYSHTFTLRITITQACRFKIPFDSKASRIVWPSPGLAEHPLWGLPDLTDKSRVLSRGRAFQRAFTWLVGLPGSLKDRCVGNGVNRILLGQTFPSRAAQFSCWAATANALFSVNWEIHKLQEGCQQSCVESGETQEKLARFTDPVELHTRGLVSCSSSRSCPLPAACIIHLHLSLPHGITSSCGGAAYI